MLIDLMLNLPVLADFHSQRSFVSLGLLLRYHTFLVPLVFAGILRVKNG